MCKLVSADDDGDQAGDFGYRAGEERLQGGEAGVEWRLRRRLRAELRRES